MLDNLPSQLPDTPAGHQLDAFLAAFNTGDRDVMRRFIADRYDPSLLERLPADAHAWDAAVAYHNTSGLAVERIERDNGLELVVRARPLKPLYPPPHECRLGVAVAAAAPHLITALALAPVLPPATALDCGRGRLTYIEMGTGSPTVVLEAGWGWGSEAWSWVLGGIAQVTRVVAYNRAGLGGSAPTTEGSRSGTAIARDLHALLAMAAIPGPYVMVGHSVGGLLVRVFAHLHPAEVAGLVLIDPTHPDAWGGRELALLPAETAADPPAVRSMRRWLTTDMYDTESVPEHLDVAAVVAEGRACGSLGYRPLAVVHAGQYVRDPELPQELTAAISTLRDELHHDLARLSSRSFYLVAEQSDHFVQFDQPALVVDAVRRVVEMVRMTDRRPR